MDAQFVNMYRVELSQGTPPVIPLRQIYYGDVAANRVGAIVLRDGAPVTLSGTCSGTAILADGSTVAITGTVDGSQAYVQLPAACYSVPGQIQVYVKLSADGVTTTLLAAVGTVRLTETDTVIDPGTIIPSVAALIDEIDAAVASIPPDYSDLVAQVDYITNKTGLETDVTADITMTNGKYVAGSNGKLASNADYAYGNFYSVDGFDKIKITMPKVTASSTSIGIAFYTAQSADNFVSGAYVTRNQAEMGWEVREFDIPATAKYFRATWYASNGTYSTLASNFACTLVKNSGIGIDQLAEVDVTGEIVSGYVNTSDGELKTSASYNRTLFIPVLSGISYYYSGQLNSGCCVGGFDDNGVFVAAVLAPNASTSYTDQLLTIPAGVKYIMASKLAAGSPDLKIVAKGENIKALEFMANDLYNKALALKPEQMTSVALFERIGVLGDSFSSGGIYSIPGATTGAHYGISWPTIMGRMEGVTCTPFASPGVNAKDFLTNERCLPALLTADPCNLYVFLLGINAEETTGTVADINDADYTQNPDTFCGNMGRIYAQLIAHAPNAKVIFVKPPIGGDERRAAIESIANHYSVPWFDTLDDIYYHTILYMYNKGDGHPVGVTYAGMAQAMRRQIAKCMCDNISYFQNYTGND